MKPTGAALVLAAMAPAIAAAAEGELHIYNWSNYIAEDTIAKFEAETGIEVTYDVYDSNEVAEAKLLAGSSGYDIVVPTSNFLRRQVAAGIYQPLDRSKMPNWDNLSAPLMEQAAAYDEGNAHSVIYMWGTNGIGYNVAEVEERLGPDAPTDSLALVFDPAHAEKLADCGITFLNSPSEMIPLALNYLGLPPDSTDPEHLEQVAQLFEAVRPHLRYFHSSQYISDLANGEVCVSVGFSGDVFIAADEAAEGIEIAYSIPKEGTLQWFDLMAIPADAPNPEAAHAFIDFVLRPEIIADITNAVFYANAVPASLEHVAQEIKDDPAIYPPEEVIARMFPSPNYASRDTRAMTRLWTRIRSGQ